MSKGGRSLASETGGGTEGRDDDEESNRVRLSWEEG